LLLLREREAATGHNAQSGSRNKQWSIGHRFLS
jgi:hypothetical protein